METLIGNPTYVSLCLLRAVCVPKSEHEEHEENTKDTKIIGKLTLRCYKSTGKYKKE